MEGRYRSSRLLASSRETQTQIFQVTTVKDQVRCLKRQGFSSAEERNSAYLLQSLQKVLVHSGILKVFRSFAGEDEEGCFLETELEWGGMDLEKVTALKAKRKTPWTGNEWATVFESMISALAFAQRLGICHRDIKPMNIFQTETGCYKLGDFGCAKSAEDLNSIHTITGTPLFLSPKLRQAYSGQISGIREEDQVEHDPYKSDVYSLGLTGLYLLKGRMLEYFGKPEEVAREVKKLEAEEWQRTVLQAMLEVEEDRRPNFLTLEELWTRLKRPEAPSNSMGLQPKKTSRLKRVSLYETRSCLSCNDSFLFNQDDKWRTTAPAIEATNFCSERCWTIQSQLDVPIDMHCRECGLADEALYFLHCGLHLVCISHHGPEESLRREPLMRKVCPDCPQPQVSSQMVCGRTFYTTTNCPAHFLKVSQEDQVAYLPVSRDIVDILTRAECHFCKGELQEKGWSYLPHNGIAAFICSRNCFNSNVFRSDEQSCYCQVCRTAIPTERVEMLGRLEATFVWTSEDLCSFCRFRPAIILFMCNQRLCLPCLCATYCSVQAYFSCPCCGLAILQADYFDLLRELKLLS